MFRSPGIFDWVSLVLLRSVFASTVNAILIGLVLCTFSTLMLLLIKCKTTWAYVMGGLFGGRDMIREQHSAKKGLKTKKLLSVLKFI